MDLTFPYARRIRMRPNSGRLLDAISLGLNLGSSSQERRRALFLSTAMGLTIALAGCGGSPGLTPDGSAGMDREPGETGAFDVATGAAGDTGTTIQTDTGTDADRAGADGDAADGDATDTGGHVPDVGTDGPAVCGRTFDRASIRVVPGDGTVWSCDPRTSVDGGSDSATADGGLDAHTADGSTGPEPATTLRGTITGGDASSLVIDSCDGAQDCIRNAVRIEVNAPGLDLTTVPRVRVEVKFQFHSFYTCQASLQIRTVDPADGSASSAPADRLLLSVVDGGLELPGSPYSAARVPLGCSIATENCVGPSPPGVDYYAFDFSMASDSASAMRVYMGQTDTWTTGGRSYKVRNLRSFQTCVFDDYWNWAYYIVTLP
jgi:hypothetical protein